MVKCSSLPEDGGGAFWSAANVLLLELDTYDLYTFLLCYTLIKNCNKVSRSKMITWYFYNRLFLQSSLIFWFLSRIHFRVSIITVFSQVREQLLMMFYYIKYTVFSDNSVHYYISKLKKKTYIFHIFWLWCRGIPTIIQNENVRFGKSLIYLVKKLLFL